MQLTQWTLFIDMLGYRDINGVINSDKEAEDFIAFMLTNKNIFHPSNYEAIKETYANDPSFDLYKYYDIQSAFVSDSLIITYKPKVVNEPEKPGLADMHSANALFIVSKRLGTFIFKCFQEKGIFLRGGVSNKYCYIKESFAVGQGLIEAYIAESQFAKTPRIILHPEIEKNTSLMEKIKFLADKMYSGKSIIQKDVDDLYFIDHIGHIISFIDTSIPMVNKMKIENPEAYVSAIQTTNNYIKTHAEAITNKLHELNALLESIPAGSTEADKVKKIIAKFEWLKTYHNSKILGHDRLNQYTLT